MPDKTQEWPARNEKKPNEEQEIGGFNPERRNEKPKPQVGPAPTDDPSGKADSDTKRKIKEGLTRLPPD